MFLVRGRTAAGKRAAWGWAFALALSLGLTGLVAQAGAAGAGSVENKAQPEAAPGQLLQPCGARARLRQGIWTRGISRQAFCDAVRPEAERAEAELASMGMDRLLLRVTLEIHQGRVVRYFGLPAGGASAQWFREAAQAFAFPGTEHAVVRWHASWSRPVPLKGERHSQPLLAGPPAPEPVDGPLTAERSLAAEPVSSEAEEETQVGAPEPTPAPDPFAQAREPSRAEPRAPGYLERDAPTTLGQVGGGGPGPESLGGLGSRGRSYGEGYGASGGPFGDCHVSDLSVAQDVEWLGSHCGDRVLRWIESNRAALHACDPEQSGPIEALVDSDDPRLATRSEADPRGPCVLGVLAGLDRTPGTTFHITLFQGTWLDAPRDAKPGPSPDKP